MHLPFLRFLDLAHALRTRVVEIGSNSLEDTWISSKNENNSLYFPWELRYFIIALAAKGLFFTEGVALDHISWTLEASSLLSPNIWMRARTMWWFEGMREGLVFSRCQ